MTPKRQESLELVLLLLVMPIFGWCGPRVISWARSAEWFGSCC